MADAATWTERVAAWRASGRTTAEFCEDRDYAASTLRWWSSRLARMRAERRRPTVRMARVLRASSSTAARPSAPASATGECPIVIELGGARVSVREGFDPATLASVLEVLAATARGATR